MNLSMIIKQFIKFVFFGIINTMVGYASFIFLLKVVNLNFYFSNAASYVVGLTSAFLFNKYFIFKSSADGMVTGIRFLIAFLCAFVINLLVAASLIHFDLLNIYVTQAISMAIYTISFYILNKYYVWQSQCTQ
jgi:putative flippase GtrA